MEAPLCKICDPPRRHWSNEPHHVNERPAKRAGDTLVADKAVPKPAAPKRKETAQETLLRVAKERIEAKPAVQLTSRGTPRQRAPKGTFDRKAYQRDKARERRARKNQEKPNGESTD